MTDVATALKWAREFGLGPNSPAQVLADALETAWAERDEWVAVADEHRDREGVATDRALRMESERDAALDALKEEGERLHRAHGTTYRVDPKTFAPEGLVSFAECPRGDCARVARALLAGSEPTEAGS